MSVNDPMMESKHHDPMLDGITRYTMLVEVDYMGFGAGIAAEPNPDGGWINAADLPALLEQARADAEQRVSEAILLEYATNMPTRTYEQGQRDERERLLTDALWKRGQALFLTEGDVDRLRRLVQRDEREACIALVETVAQSGAYIDYVEIDSVIAAIRARSDGGES